MWWRVHADTGHGPWNRLRSWGPLTSARFDPHPAGAPQDHPGCGVLYAADDLPTALAEVYQSSRVVNTRRGDPAAYAFRSTRPVKLLDLSGFWPLRAGASHAINTGRKDFARRWARMFTAVWPECDGVRYTSSMSGRPCAVFYHPAESAIPDGFEIGFPLAQPAMSDWMLAAAAQIGYQLT